MAEKNSLWRNIRKKAEQNRRTGAKPKKPTKEMLDQEKKIKANQKADGGPVGNDPLYNMQRALELGYTPDETGHWDSVDSETGMWLKSKKHPTAWMEYMYGYALNPEVQKQYQHPVVNPEGYFGENQLQYNKKAQGGKLYPDGGKIYTDDEMQRIIKSQQRNRTYASGKAEMPLDEIITDILLGGRGFGMSQQSGMKYSPPKFQNIPEDIESHPYPLKIQERNSPLPIVRKSKQYEDGGPVTLYKKAQYDVNTDRILEYAGSQGNKYYVTPDTPEGIDFESRLPEFEVIEDTGKYNPNTFGYTAPEYIPSETGLVPNPKYIPLASGALEPVYPEAALLPASLPFKATTRLGKAALFGAELANPLGGFKNFSVKNKVGEVKNQLSKAVKGTSSVLDELKGELLQGKLNRESIKKGNKWLENWIKHPATKEKINTTIDNKIDFVKQFYDNPIEEVDLLNLIRTQSRDFKPNSKEYSLLKQLDNNLQQYLSKKSRSPIHQGNWGVSYQHQYSPKERLNIEIGVEKPLSDRYGSWISRTTKLPQKNRVSTTIHEGTHDWISEEAFKKSGMRNIALQNMDPKIKNDFLEWESYRELGIDPAEKMGKERAYQAYLADPTEQHARIMELRHDLDITPDYKMYEETAKGIIDWIDKGGSSIDPKFLNVINKDPKKLTELFNRFWKAPPAIIGTGAMQGSQPEQQSQGGHINPYMYYAGGPMQYSKGGNFAKHVGAGAYALGEGILDTVTMGATDQLTDKGFEWLTKVGNKNLDLNDPDDVKFLKTQQQVKGYSNTAGAIGTAVLTGNVQGAIGQGTKGLNTAFQASDWATDDFKKWSQGISGVAGMAAGFAGGLNSDSFNAAAKAGTGIAGFGQKAGKIGSFGNQVTGMFGGNQQSLLEQAEARQDYLNSPEYLAMRERQNQAYVNQGLSFANGGNINNNSLNLQIDSMRNRYKTYKTKYRQGGSMNQSNVDFISDEAGLHQENVYNGVPLTRGEGAYANGGAALVEAGEGVIRDKQGNPSFILPDQGDGEPVYMLKPNASHTGFEKDKNGNYIQLPITVADWRKKEEKRGSNFRDPENDYISNPRKDNANQLAMAATEIQKQLKAEQAQQKQMMIDGALQYAAAGGRLNKDISKIVEEEYAAAYGGYINPKKYKGLNMPYSKGGKLPKEILKARVESHMSPEEADAYVNQYAEGGGIHIKESKKGTFTAAATKHGKSVQEFAKQVLANKGNYSPAMVKKANFARNAASWKHSQGGPVVSNVNQDFDLYAQNRGGMMMAQGGNMYAMGGPPDGDPNSLDYITRVSDFMYSPEFLNYWTNTQDKRNINYESIYDRGNLPLSEERFSPTEGISDFDRTLGNLYSAEKVIFLNTNPDGSVCYMIDGQKVCGPPGQIQAMLANRDRTYQSQAVADVYQNTTGDFAPYNYNNITGSTAARPVNQPDYSGNQNFTDRQNTIRGMVSNAMTRNQSTSVQPIGRMQSRNLQQLPTDNTMLGIIGNVENPINFSNTAGFIPSDVMSGKLGTSNAPFPYEEGPINTSIPRDISAKQSVRFTQPMGSDIIEDLPGFTPNQTKVSNEEIGQSYLGTAANPNLPKLTFTQSDATKYGLNPNDVNIIKDPKVNQPNWYDEPLYSKVARYSQAIPGVIASITALQNKKRKLPYRNLDTQTVNYEPERIIDREESRRRFNTFADRMKNIASNAGMLAGNLRGTLLGSNKELAGRIAESVMREKNTNAQLAQQAAMTQFGANRETDALNEQMFQNAQTQAIAGLQDTTGKLAGAAGEERKQYLQEWIAKNKLKTRDFIQGPDGSYYYEAPDGTLTKV